MNCDDVQEQLGALVDQQMSEETSVAVQAHLAGCEICRAERESLITLHAALSRAFLTEQRQASAVAERVLQYWSSSDVGPSSTALKRSIRHILGYLIAAAAGFFLAVGLLQRWDVGGQPNGLDPLAGKSNPQAEKTGPSPVVPVAQLVHAIGLVSFQPPADEEWVSVRPEELPTFTCPPHSSLRTEPGSLCELETSSGSRIRLNESCEVALVSDEEFELVQGQIWCRTAKSQVLRVVTKLPPQAPQPPEGQVMLQCPTSTEFLTSCSPDGLLQVVAAAGTVDLTIEGDERRLEPGTIYSLGDGSLRVWESAEELLRAASWMQPLLTLAGHDNPELFERVDALLAHIGRAKVSFLYEQELRNLGEYAVLPLMKFVQSDQSRNDPSRRLVAMRIISDTAPVWIVPDLVSLLEDDEPEVRTLAARALTRITGETQGLAAEAWQSDRPQWIDGVRRWRDWWQQHRFSCSPSPSGVTRMPVLSP